MKMRITVDGKSYEVDVEVVGESNHGMAAAPGASAGAPVAPRSRPAASAPERAAPAAAGNDKVVRAPLAGTVVTVLVKPGDTIDLNQVLLTMEAMKMETNIATPMAGTVLKVNVVPGQAVKTNEVLVELAS